VARRLRVHAGGREKVLYADRHAFHRACAPARDAAIRFLRHCERPLRRLGDVGVEASRGLHRAAIGTRQFDFPKVPLGEPVPDFGDGQCRQIGPSTTFGTTKKSPASAGALAVTASAALPSVTTSSRIFIVVATTVVIGSTPVTSTSLSCSTKPRMPFS